MVHADPHGCRQVKCVERPQVCSGEKARLSEQRRGHLVEVDSVEEVGDALLGEGGLTLSSSTQLCVQEPTPDQVGDAPSMALATASDSSSSTKSFRAAEVSRYHRLNGLLADRRAGRRWEWQP